MVPLALVFRLESQVYLDEWVIRQPVSVLDQEHEPPIEDTAYVLASQDLVDKVPVSAMALIRVGGEAPDLDRPAIGIQRTGIGVGTGAMCRYFLTASRSGNLTNSRYPVVNS